VHGVRRMAMGVWSGQRRGYRRVGPCGPERAWSALPTFESPFAILRTPSETTRAGFLTEDR
jgi:hypothetical protein